MNEIDKLVDENNRRVAAVRARKEDSENKEALPYHDPYLFSVNEADGSSLRIVVTGVASALEACRRAREIINVILKEIEATKERGGLLEPGESVVRSS